MALLVILHSEITPFTPPRTPQNHPTVTILNRVCLRRAKKILKILSKSDEKRRGCVVYEAKFRKIPPFTPPRTPQNHPTVTIFNRVSLRWVKKIF